MTVKSYKQLKQDACFVANSPVESRNFYIDFIESVEFNTGAGGSLTDGAYGDVVVSGSGTVWTVTPSTISGVAGDVVAAGKQTSIDGVLFENPTVGNLTVPTPATEANMAIAGFTPVGASAGATNLGISNNLINTLDVTSSTGSGVTLPAVTTTAAGVMTGTDKVKLDALAAGAEINVQADWSQTTVTADDYILNKPTTITAAESAAIVANTAKITYPSADSTKLAGVEAGATADKTDAEIKTAYEANADTNAYTDAEKSGLASAIAANFTHVTRNATANDVAVAFGEWVKITTATASDTVTLAASGTADLSFDVTRTIRVSNLSGVDLVLDKDAGDAFAGTPSTVIPDGSSFTAAVDSDGNIIVTGTGAVSAADGFTDPAVSNTWSQEQVYGAAAANATGSVSVDFDASVDHLLTMTGNITEVAFTGGVDRSIYTIDFVQDAATIFTLATTAQISSGVTLSDPALSSVGTMQVRRLPGGTYRVVGWDVEA